MQLQWHTSCAQARKGPPQLVTSEHVTCDVSWVSRTCIHGPLVLDVGGSDEVVGVGRRDLAVELFPVPAPVTPACAERDPGVSCRFNRRLPHRIDHTSVR